MKRIIAILLCLCASLQLLQRHASANTYTDIGQLEETRVFVTNRCLFHKEPKVPFLGALAAAVLPSLIEKGLSTFATAIRKAGEKGTKSASASVSVELGNRDLPACVQIIHGSFFLSNASFAEDKFAASNPLQLPDDRSRKTVHSILAGVGAYVAGPPLFFFEGKIRRSEDGSAIAIGPTMILYNALIESSPGQRKKGTRDIVISFSLSAGGSGGLEDRGTIGQLEFKGLQTGTKLRFPDIQRETPWIPLQLAENKTPRTVSLTISETKDANEFLLLIADVLDGSKENVEALLKQTLIESERVKVRKEQLAAEKEKQQAEAQLLISATQAEAQARVSLLEYKSIRAGADPIELVKKASGALVNLIEANLKAKQAGLPVPFDPNEILDLQAAMGQ